MFRLLSLICILVCTSVSYTQEGLESAVRLALHEGLPQVAVVKMERALKESAKPDAEMLKLGIECYVRAGRAKEALELMALHRSLPDVAFWEGQACLMLHDVQGAKAAFEQVKSGPLLPYAALGLVEVLRMQGEGTEARKLLQTLRQSEDSLLGRKARLLFSELELEKGRISPVLRRLKTEEGGKDAAVQLLRARALIQQGDLKMAEGVLRDLLASDGVGERSHDAATVMLARILMTATPLKARAYLVALIDSLHPHGPSPARDSDYLHDAFLLLREIPNSSAQDTLLSTLIGWSAFSEPAALRGYALELASHLLSEQGRVAESAGLLEAFISLCPAHARRESVLRKAAELHGSLRHDERLLALAELWRKEFGRENDSAAMDVMVASIRYGRQEYAEAQQLFLKVADGETDLQRRRLALYNGAVSAMQAKNAAGFQMMLAQLQSTGTAVNGVLDPAGLELDRALQLAKDIDPEANTLLRKFIDEQGNHPRQAEALLALAELNLLETPPLVKGAREALEAATVRATDQQREQVDYLRVWLREAEGDLMALTRDGLMFVEHWQPRPRCAEVLMKVAESYYRLEDFSSAQAKFADVAAKYPDSPYTETALFYAGKAALSVNTQRSLNEAINHWQEVAQLGGKLAFAARFHQAVAKRLQGQTDEAIQALEQLLKDAKITEDQRRTLSFEKAEILISAGGKERKYLDEAETLLRVLQSTAPNYEWRARASVLLASVYSDMKRSSEALEAAWEAVQALPSGPNEPPAPTEYEWYCRAGFIALNLLEKNQQWESAAKLAEKLASTKGHRSKEASERATRIRLEHFLWDGSSAAATKQ